MKLTEQELERQVLELPQRNGSIRRFDPFVPHERPDQPQTEKITIPLPGGPREIETDTSSHGAHSVVIRFGEDDLRSHLVLCDGTVISAQD